MNQKNLPEELVPDSVPTTFLLSNGKILDQFGGRTTSLRRFVKRAEEKMVAVEGVHTTE